VLGFLSVEQLMIPRQVIQIAIAGVGSQWHHVILHLIFEQAVLLVQFVEIFRHPAAIAGIV
jgi:hypothetical protein